MLTLACLPRNREHFAQLWEFCEEVLTICHRLEVEPVMNASLAVLAYSASPDLEVHDVDLSCPEADFVRIAAASEEAGIEAAIQEWHVLELHRGGLKVEFDGNEHWMQGLVGTTGVLHHGAGTVRVVCREDLATLYRRGVDAYLGRPEPAVQRRLLDLQRKLDLVLSAKGATSF